MRRGSCWRERCYRLVSLPSCNCIGSPSLRPFKTAKGRKSRLAPDALFASLDRSAHSGSSTNTPEPFKSATSRRVNHLDFALMRLFLLKRRRFARFVSCFRSRSLG
jgi:hypothetical protein